jgi:DNA mismatch repair protein MutS
MELDYQTVRKLAVSSLRTGIKGHLLWVLDKPHRHGVPDDTVMITPPALKPRRHQAQAERVGELVKSTVQRSELIPPEKRGDMERIMASSRGSANARDLAALAESARCIPLLKAQLYQMKSSVLMALNQMDDLGDIVKRIDDTIGDDPPFSIREGGMIRPGFNPEVDRLRGLLNNSSERLQRSKREERERKTGKS